jgi:hypothetical protein
LKDEFAVTFSVLLAVSGLKQPRSFEHCGAPDLAFRAGKGSVLPGDSFHDVWNAYQAQENRAVRRTIRL